MSCPGASISRTLAATISASASKENPSCPSVPCCVPLLRTLLALGLVATFLAAPCSGASAKGTGLIFVSNEKTNNIIVIDPKTNKVVKDLKNVAAAARHAFQRRSHQALRRLR